MANFLDMFSFSKSEDPRIAECAQARSRLIGDYLGSNPTLSKERHEFFQTLATENQKPYCDGSKTMGPVTDSSPVILTEEQLNKLLKLPITDQ
jgi:hypothetical protein